MSIVLIVLFCVVCLLFVIEKRVNLRCRASFEVVVHVNGIRGKTSVCRLLDAALRGRYRVFTKTTGTDPRVIGVDGIDRPLVRMGPANINEQLRIMRRARREGAQVLILECMAVAPELQAISQNEMVKSDISVITNVRYDHVYEMGEELEEIAQALAAVVPERGILYTADATFYPMFSEASARKGGSAVLCAPEGSDDENRAVARAVARGLGMEDVEIDAGFAAVQQDFGVSRAYAASNENGEPVQFLNLFSVNDPESSISRLSEMLETGESPSEVVFVYNNRLDRPDRTLLFAKHFFVNYPNARVYVMGGGARLAGRILRKSGVRVQCVRRWEQCFDLPRGALLVGLGNIKWQGHKMVEAMERKGEAHD